MTRYPQHCPKCFAHPPLIQIMTRLYRGVIQGAPMWHCAQCGHDWNPDPGVGKAPRYKTQWLDQGREPDKRLWREPGG